MPGAEVFQVVLRAYVFGELGGLDIQAIEDFGDEGAEGGAVPDVGVFPAFADPINLVRKMDGVRLEHVRGRAAEEIHVVFVVVFSDVVFEVRPEMLERSERAGLVVSEVLVGRGEDDGAAGSGDTKEFAHEFDRIGHVFDDVIADHEIEPSVGKLSEAIVINVSEVIDGDKGIGGDFGEQFGGAGCVHRIEIFDRCGHRNVGGFVESPDFKAAPGEGGVNGITMWTELHGKRVRTGLGGERKRKIKNKEKELERSG